MKSARIVALVALAAGLFLNEWAFRFLSSTPPIDSFMRLMMLLADVFMATFIFTFLWENVSLATRVRTLISRHSRSVAVFFGLALAYGTALTVEFGCRYYFKHLYSAPYSAQTYWEPSANKRDSIMGSVLLRDTVISHAYVVNDSLIYKQYYHIDELGRRITPAVHPDSVYRQFAMITGCSFAFGYGLDEHQTLSYFVDSLTGLRAYNYAVSGYGTQQTLELLKNRNLHAEIEEPNGVLIHLFIDDHLNRLIGSRRLIKLWASHFPYYYLDGEELKRDGSFLTGRTWQTRLYRALSESAFIGLFNIEIPWRITDAHLQLFATVMKQAEKEFLRQYPAGKFVVVIGPNATLAPRALAALTDKNITVLDGSNLLDTHKAAYKIHWTEGHPSAQYHLEVADTLVQFLLANPN